MPPTSPDPVPENNKKNEIDLGKILLPKKDAGPSVDSAERINAGALFEQERAAAASVPAASAPAAPRPAASQPATAAGQIPSTPVAPAVPKKEEAMVRAVETYTSDISRVVKEGGVSTVTIAAAEAERRARATSEEALAPGQLAPEAKTSRWRIVLIIVSVALIISGLALAATLFLRPSIVAPAQTAVPDAPFITVDEAADIRIPSNVSRDSLMTQLEATREQVNISLGLVEWFRLLAPATTTGQFIDLLPAQQFFSVIAPNMPPDLLRSIRPQFLLGIHSYDENQSFLVFQVDSYQQGYSGLLAWEQTMPQELAPLFTRHPAAHIQNTIAATTTATTTATSTTNATSTAAASSTPGTVSSNDAALAALEFLHTDFVDQVVENHDARVLLNSQGDILLLWTFLDRNTVVITTNEATLREVIRRINTPAVIPQQ